MRFLELALLKFGPFTDRVLDFAAGGNLRLIYGPNEAGKSTALRAVRGFLYGIPARTTDAHAHAMKDLRVGATLVNAAGDRVQLVRRKGTKNTLLDAANEPVDEGVLRRMLGGVGDAYFTKMFGLDHAGLIDGGDELLAGQGELGQVLFGVGAGVGSMRSVLSRLRADAAELFRPRGSKQQLNKALAEYKDARKRCKEAALHPKDYAQVEEDLAQLDAALAALNERCADALNERARLDRLRRVIPVVRRKEDCERSLAALGACPLLPEAAARDRAAAQAALVKLAEQRARLVRERDECIEQRTHTTVPRQILAHEAALEPLERELGAVEKAARDRADLDARVNAASAELRAELRALGKEAPLDDIERLRIAAPVRARIQQLAKDRGKIVSERDAATHRLEEAARKAAQLRVSLDAVPPAVDVANVRYTVAAARKAGDLERRHRDLAADIALHEQHLGDMLASLPRWRGGLDALARSPVPDGEVIELFRARLDQAERRLDGAQDDCARIREELDKVDAAIAALQAGGAVPTRADLEAARRTRDQWWDQARAVWIDGVSAGEDGPQRLAERVSESIAAADRVADRLCNDAERSGRLGALASDHARLRTALERHGEEIERREHEREELRSEWRACWASVPVDLGSPAEMTAWRARYDKIAAAAQRLGDERQQLEALAAEIDDCRTRCNEMMHEVGQRAAPPSETLAALLDRAAAFVGEIEERESTRARLRCELDELAATQQELSDAATRRRDADARWSAAWADAMREIGLHATASTAEAEALLDGLQRAFERWSDICQTRERIRHIQANADEFAGRVRALVARCAPDIDATATQDASAELVRRLREAVRARDTDERLRERITSLNSDLRRVDEQIAHERATLRRLMEQAGVTDEAQLEAAEQRSTTRRKLEDTVEACQEQLAAENAPLDQLVRDAHDVDPDRLPGLVDEVSQRLTAAEKERDDLQDRAAELRARRRAMDGSSRAADEAEQAQRALAAARTHAETFACLALAARMLEDEIDRYRRDHQGPIVQRAGAMFERITRGSFARLTTDFGANDETVLLCERPNGETLPIAALSEGTRDQLYLSLRLASLELRAQTNEPLPLVLDDLLIHFDDERAEATLAVLAELAESMQILFFTHHTRLLELAERAAPAAAWARHDLS